MKKIVRALPLLLLTTGAQAQWSAGVIGLGQSNPYIGGDTGLDIFPMVAYEGEKLVWRGPFLDYFLVGGSRSEQSFSINIALAPADFDPDGDPDLAGINERKNSVMAGVSYNQAVWGGKLYTSLQGEITNRHSGQRATLGWQTPIAQHPEFRWQLTAGIELEYLSEDYADYYYGISAQESASSDFDVYQVSSVVQPEVSLSGFYRISENWQGVGNIGLQKLDSSIKDSPIVDADWVANGFAGVTYSF